MKKTLVAITMLALGVLVQAQTIMPVPFLSRISGGDTTPNYLFSKLVAGAGITLTKNNPGANETITITSASGSFSTTTINGVATTTFTFSTSTTGTDFNISTTTNTVIFNLPTASAVNRGALSPTDWSTFNNKVSSAYASSTYVAVVGNQTIAGDKTFNGKTTLGVASTTAVTATDIYTTTNTVSGNQTTGGTLSVTGKTTLANASSTSLTVSGQSTLASTTVTGIVSVTGKIGVSSSTPTNSISVATGSILVTEFVPNSTSTSMTLNVTNSNTTLIKYGVSNIVIGFSNYIAGQTWKVVTCAPPSGTPGTVFFATTSPGVTWTGGSLPASTATGKKCDVWSFIATQGTSSSAVSPAIFGAMVSNF